MTASVSVTLKTDSGEQELTLKPSPTAIQTLSRYSNGQGIIGLISRCVAFDFDVIVQVIQVGSGSKDKNLAEKIFATGLPDLAAPCTKFLGILANGGRDTPDEAAQQADAQ
jgi:hypothetical protein